MHWNAEGRLTEAVLPSGVRNTMTYRPDGVRQQVADSAGQRDLVWDSRGSSGYGDLLQERSAGSAVRTYHRGDLLAALAEAGAAGETGIAIGTRRAACYA